MSFSLRWMLLLLFICTYLQTPTRVESAQSDAQFFDHIFANWTQAFNNKDLEGATSLFSRECIATMPDAPHKNFDAIYEGFKKMFASKTDSIKYKYKIQKIYRSGDLATVRITWYASAYKQGKFIATSTEQGLDVFKKNKSGEWKIVNFIAYTEK